jgi:hypothetical protein
VVLPPVEKALGIEHVVIITATLLGFEYAKRLGDQALFQQGMNKAPATPFSGWPLQQIPLAEPGEWVAMMMM